jgi:hypothetical protein
MNRAGHRAAHGREQVARTLPGQRRRHGHSQDEVVAEVSSRAADGAYVARLHRKGSGLRGRYGNAAGDSAEPVIVASARVQRRSFPTAAPATPTSSRDSFYAQGTAHPSDDERVPVGLPSSQAVIGTAQAMAAPSAATATVPRTPQPQVIAGFGGEVAVASPTGPGRPGGTRRRNHPVPASALPENMPPPTLEDRAAITEAAVRPNVLPAVYDRNGHLMMPAALKGSREVLVHQNLMANSDGLERIQDDGELDRLRAEHQLVSFPVSDSLRLNEDLPYNRRYARPWTVLFAQDIARDFYARFHQPLQVNSAVRTVAYQLRLQRVNGNAAAADGDAASPHLTGQAIDLGKRGMSVAELAWMRQYLVPLMQGGKIDVEEEFQQACFHISVYRRYGAGRRPVREMAQVGVSGPQNPAPVPAAEPAGAQAGPDQ